MRSVFSAYGLAWLWVSTVIVLLLAVASMRASGVPGLTFTDSYVISQVPALRLYLAASPWAALFAMLVFAPLFEEALFRMFPLSFALVMGGLLQGKFERRGRNFIRATLIVVCCLVFGLLHKPHSFFNILVQGFVGLTLGRLYLKHSDNQLKSYGACVLVHAMYNFTVLAAANLG